ncbi:MAG: type VI-B CRISPR-associated RNA-guided ribonuclease Cas13b, partial [bacterium]
FFVCLFLENKHAHEYLKKQKGYKSSHTPEHRATLKTYTFYSIKLPRPVFESRDMKLRLILDALNELKRCPKQLYDHLPEKYQKFCQVESVKQKENEETGETEEIKEYIPFIRHEDKFPYYALRFIDDLELLKDIRFKIKRGLGKEIFHTHETATQPVVRNKKIFTFGRFQEVYEGERNDPDNNLWHIAPAYAFEKDGNIKIKITKNEKTSKSKDDTSSNNVAYAELSVYELRNLVYCCLNGKKDAANNIIRDYVFNYKTFLKDLESNNFPKIDYTADLKERKKQLQNILESDYNLQLHQLPKKIRKILLDEKIQNYKSHAIQKIKDRQDENERILKKIESRREKNKGNNKDTQQKNTLKTGQLASELANDIQNYLPENYKLELFQYRDLQKQLAYYRRKNIYTLLNQNYALTYHEQQDRNENFNDLYYEKKHPFLHHVLSRKDNDDIFSFAFNYFKSKNIWLKKVLEKATGLNDTDIPKYSNLFYYFKPGTSVNDKGEKIYYRKYDDHYLNKLIQRHLKQDHVINIPRGILNQFICPEKESYKQENNPIQEIADQYPSTQDFYKFPRFYHPTGEVLPVKDIHYKLVELSKDKDHPQNKNKKEHKKAYNQLKNYLRKEKTIRYTQSCDRVLLEMIKYYLNNYFKKSNKEFELDLTDVELRDLFKYDETKEYIDNKLDQTMITLKFHVNGQPFRAEDKLNNFGKLHRYIYDERFVSIYKYKGNKAFEGVKTESTYSQLEEILEVFAKEQLELFEYVQQFEKAMTTKFKDKARQKKAEENARRERNGKPLIPEHYFPISILLSVAEEWSFISEETRNFINTARNSAAHNKLDDEYIKMLKDRESEKDYFEAATKIFNDLTEKIKTV